MDSGRRAPTQAPPSDGGAGASTRQCAVCRRRQPPAALVQLKQLAPTARRAAYVCIDATCLAAAQHKHLARAVRAPVPPAPPGAVQAALREMARTRLLALVGLARRCGALLVGVQALAEAGERAAVALVAHDLAARGARRLEGLAPPGPGFASADELGAAAGHAPTGALGIRPGRLATQAAYWLRVWYATQHQLGTV